MSADDSEEKPKKKKKIKKKYIAYGVIGLISLIVWAGMQPLTGTIEYGVCKTLAELKIKYPDTMRTNSVQYYDRALRVYFTSIDGYGQDKLEFIECTFKPDPDVGFVLEAAQFNRTILTEAEIALFNKSIPSILAFPPDLALPHPSEDALKDFVVDESMIGQPVL
jgi:hypothetical protein